MAFFFWLRILDLFQPQPIYYESNFARLPPTNMPLLQVRCSADILLRIIIYIIGVIHQERSSARVRGGVLPLAERSAPHSSSNQERLRSSLLMPRDEKI